MASPISVKPSTASFHLTVRFEGMPEGLPDSRIYALDSAGQVLASQQVSRGCVEMRLPVEALSRVTLAIGPAQRDASPKATGWHPLFTTDWEFEPGISQYALRSVPENVWRWWLVSSLNGILWPEQPPTRRFMVF